MVWFGGIILIYHKDIRCNWLKLDCAGIIGTGDGYAVASKGAMGIEGILYYCTILLAFLY